MLILRRWRAARARDLVGADSRRIEPPSAAEHLVDRLVEVGGGLPLEAQRVDARDDERLEIGTLESSTLERFHGLVHELVELEQFLRSLPARQQRVGKL